MANQAMNGRVVCGAKKRNGEPCQKSPIKGRTRCRLHGGASPRGPAHPSYKHGRYSSAMPERLAARFEAAASDPELLSLRADIALVQARILDRLEQEAAGGGVQAPVEMIEAWMRFRAARASGDGDAMWRALGELDELFGLGRETMMAQRDIERLQDHKRKLSEAEVKRLSALDQYISIEEALNVVVALAQTVTAIIREYTDDPSAIRAIDSAVVGLLDRGVQG